jgi:hypothetical protein
VWQVAAECFKGKRIMVLRSTLIKSDDDGAQIKSRHEVLARRAQAEGHLFHRSRDGRVVREGLVDHRVELSKDDEPDQTSKMMKTMVKAWINNFDMDRDSFLERDEVSLWMTNERGDDDEKRTDNMMNMIDTDGDTLCSKAELEEFAQRMKNMDSTWVGMKKKATKDEL